MPEDKLPIPKFAAKIKAKYPEYKDMNDTLLTQKILAKYPEYGDMVDMSGVDDDIKKKNGLAGGIGAYGASLLGGEVGASNGLLGGIKMGIPEDSKIGNLLSQVRKTEATKENMALIDTDIEPDVMDENDPVKTLVNPLTQRKKQIFDRQIKIESTGQNKLNKQVASDEVDDLIGSELYIKNNIFPTTQSAQLWLKQHPNYEKNQTSAIANDIVIDDNITKMALRDNGNDIPRAALQYYRAFDDNLGDKLKVWHREGIDPPPELTASLVHNFLQNRTVKELSNQSQEFHNVVKEQQDNFYQNFPDAHNQKLLSDIAKGRKDFNYNNWFANFPGIKSSDQIAESLYALGKWSRWDKEFYDKNTRQQLLADPGQIPTPGLVENTLQSASKGIEDLPKGMYSLTGLRNLVHSKGEILYEDTREDLVKPDVPKFTGLQKWSHATGSLAGLLLPIGGEAKLLTQLNIVKNAAKANELALGITFYNDIQKAETGNNPDNPMLAHLSALVQTGVWMKISKKFPKLASSIVKDARPEINTVLKNLQSGSIDNAVAEQQITKTILGKVKTISAKLGQAVSESTHTASEVSTAVAINDAVSGAISGDYDLDESVKNVGHTFESMLLGTGLLNMVKVAGGKVTAADMIDNISEHPEFYGNKIDEIAKQNADFAKQAPELKKNLILLNEVKQSLSERTELNNEQRKNYQVLELQKKILEDKAKTIPASGLKEPIEKDLAKIEIEQEKVLNPDMTNTELIEKHYDEELVPKGFKKTLEDDKGKFSEHKVGDFLKKVASADPETLKDFPQPLIDIAKKRWPEGVKEEQAVKSENEVYREKLDYDSITEKVEVKDVVTGEKIINPDTPNQLPSVRYVRNVMYKRHKKMDALIECITKSL